jgi:hypothetical protein
MAFNALILSSYLRLRSALILPFYLRLEFKRSSSFRLQARNSCTFLMFPLSAGCPISFLFHIAMIPSEELNSETLYFANDCALSYFLSFRSTSLTAQFQTPQPIFFR